MKQLIKDFLLFRRTLRNYQKIELTKSEKIKLESFDKDVLTSIVNKAYEELSRDMLSGKLSKEYVMWYKHWVNHITKYFRQYNK